MNLRAVLRVALYCLLGGIAFMLPALGAGHAPWWWLSGVLVSAAFLPAALYGPRTALGQFCVIFPVLFLVSVITIWSEALIFLRSPIIRQHAMSNIIYDTIGHLIAAIVLVVLWKLLKLTRESGTPTLRPPLMKAIGLIVVCAFVYVACYLVFGGITYQLFTKKYYPDVASIVGPLGFWFWVIQFSRGLLITLAVVPAIYTLRLPRWQAAICVGLLLWIAGGLAPLIVPNVLISAPERFIHVIEILTQNFTLGVVAGLLLRPKREAPLLAASPARPSWT